MISRAACAYSEETIERYVMGRLSPEEAAAVQEHSFHCWICQSLLREALEFVPAMRKTLTELILSGFSDSPGDRRQEPRLACDKHIGLVLLSPPYGELAGSLLNISLSGTSIRTDRPVAVDTPVEIRGPGARLSGVVRHCRPTIDSFEIGVVLAPNSPLWPPSYLSRALESDQALGDLIR